MKLVGHKRLDGEPKRRLTLHEKLMLVGLGFLFLLLGSTASYLPMTFLIFDKDYSGMMIIAIVIVLAVGIPMTLRHNGRKVYIVTAMITYILGAFITYWFVGNAFPGEEITGMASYLPMLL